MYNQNRKSKIKIEMKKHRALTGAWFKNVPLRSSCSEEINEFQPIANCQIQNVERAGTFDAKIIRKIILNLKRKTEKKSK